MKRSEDEEEKNEQNVGMVVGRVSNGSADRRRDNRQPTTDNRQPTSTASFMSATSNNKQQIEKGRGLKSHVITLSMPALSLSPASFLITN